MATSLTPLALARLVAASASECDGVAAVAPGPSGVAATHGPGGRVPGVILRPATAEGATVTVHIVAEAVSSRPDLAAAVRTAVTSALDEAVPASAPWTVDVHVADLVTPDLDRPHPLP